jgi:exopolysaccharide production protein ExoY
MATASGDPPVSNTLVTSVLFLEENRADDIFRRRVAASRLFRVQLRLKRLFDVLLSGLLLVLSSPILLIAFLAVRFSSAGPFIFFQTRWGLNGKHFECLKLRTMFIDQAARLSQEQSLEHRGQGLLLKMKQDPRVTPVGAFLRRTSIDELPQLMNVFRGDMSIVGPRPLMLHMMEPFPEIRAVRCIVRPGLTGLWQIRNRVHNTSVMDMIADDVDYIAHLSLSLDLKILLATPWELIRGTGAY